MPVQEDVLIILKARDDVSRTVEQIRRNIEDLGRTFNNSMPNPNQFTEPFGAGVDGLGGKVDQVSYSMSGFGDKISTAGSQANITFTQMAERMDHFHVGLNRVTNAMTGLFGTMGLWGMAHESWMFATQRQTNQIYLGMRRGTDEARQMYNEIQNIVMELPGDDTFLTTILTQASGRDMTMSIENVKTLGDAIADYYVGATAKGQLSYETQRELTSYILTGETRMFTNSILADEIDLLKNKNTVTERATALQEALNKTGFEGMAHYESATNAMEEFKGHFQKAFADIGSWVLPVMQLILGLYNALDSLAGNGLISAGLISIATGIALVTTALGTIGFITPMVNEGVRSLVLFGQGIRNVREGFADLGVIGFFRNHIRGLIDETTALISPLERMTQLTSATSTGFNFNFDTMTSTPAMWELENGAILTNSQLKLQNLIATTQLNERELALMITQEGVTYEQYLNNVGLDANTMAKLKNVAQTMEMSDAELLNLAVTSDMTTAEFLETLELNYNSIEKDLNTTNTILNANAELLDMEYTNLSTFAKIRNSASKVFNTAVTYLLGEAVVLESGAVVNGTVVTTEDIIVRQGGLFTRISETLQRIWHTVAVYDETVSIGINTEATATETTVKNLNIGATIRNTYATLREAISKRLSANGTLRQIINKLRKIAIDVWEIVSSTALAFAEQILAIIKGEEAIATGLLAGANIILAGSIEAVKIALGPIGAIFDAIGLSMYAILGIITAIVGAFLLLTNTGGSLDFLKGIFGDLWNSIQRIWDAFVNSEPVQQIITTFQNLWYTLETLFNFLGSIGGGLWELVFGVDDGSNSGFDLLGVILEIVGAIGNFVYWLSPLGEILSIFDAIGSAIAWVLDTWNEFIDTPEMQSLIEAFQEVRVIFGEAFTELSDAFGELWEALSEIGEAFSSVFEDDSTEDATESVNVLLELLKTLAWIIKAVVIPPLKAVAGTVKAIADGVKWVADGVQWLTGGGGENGSSNGTSVDYTTARSGMTPYNYSQSSNMTQAYNYNNPNQSRTVINYFNEGSVQADARNMSAKDVQALFTGAFGYNKARGTQGIIR